MAQIGSKVSEAFITKLLRGPEDRSRINVKALGHLARREKVSFISGIKNGPQQTLAPRVKLTSRFSKTSLKSARRGTYISTVRILRQPLNVLASFLTIHHLQFASGLVVSPAVRLRDLVRAL